TQMAQNIVLCWLAGARVIELKTIQAVDSLRIPRPCIDARTVGYNLEWSQELKLGQSYEEYVKASMLVEMLAASRVAGADPRFDRCLFDVSVGYDLDGIRSARVTGFIRAMLDARDAIEKFRREISSSRSDLGDLEYSTRIADTVTLSTFHGCPSGEIEQVVDYLMSEIGVDCAIKLNPTLLGPRVVYEILHDRFGYTDVVVPTTAFECDPTWTQAVDIIGRLDRRARSLGRHFAIKLTNTLLVENRSEFLPRSEKLAYLSGAPLHVLAMHLVRGFRQAFGGDLAISFSAGIDRVNYPDAVSIGVAPVTVCTDLLKQGGYGRLQDYVRSLSESMQSSEASSIGDFILRSRGRAAVALQQIDLGRRETSRLLWTHKLYESERLDGELPPDVYARWVAETKVLNTYDYVESLDHDPRYRSERARPARRSPRPLSLFDCATCDLCIEVCPNDALFRIPTIEPLIPRGSLVQTEAGWERRESGAVFLSRKHQIACFTDFCNDCGNCMAFCPDDGAPQQLKPRLSGSEAAWSEDPRDGFYIERDDGRSHVRGRIDGVEYALDVTRDEAIYVGRSFRLSSSTPLGLGSRFVGEGSGAIDLWPYALMDFLRRAALDTRFVNYVNSIPKGSQ
ncbi:MAG TPA: glutamate synthase, partial [Thermoanaerobaculia bacterium]